MFLIHLSAVIMVICCVLFKFQIPFARSETHLTEITENLCEKMNHYALSKNEETGKKTYVRTAAWEKGEQIELNNVDMSSEIAEELRNMVMLFSEELFCLIVQIDHVYMFCSSVELMHYSS